MELGHISINSFFSRKGVVDILNLKVSSLQENDMYLYIVEQIDLKFKLWMCIVQCTFYIV